MQDPNNLIWVDLEMTGLEPEKDRVIEIATIITDSELNTLAEGLLESAGASVPIEHAPPRAGELQRSSVNPRKLGDMLGWQPEVSLADGLLATYKWILTCP